MFRPDANRYPRWFGNLKQYQFGKSVSGTTTQVFLADSQGNPAISNAGTGFISSNAVSYWTTKDTSQLPDSIDPTGSSTGTAGGFWIKQPQSAGGGFDYPDGEIVEKGGAAEVFRGVNLQDTYDSAHATTPRTLYTCTGSCAANTTLGSSTDTQFATTNTNLTTSALGLTSTTSLTPTSITRAVSPNSSSNVGTVTFNFNSAPFNSPGTYSVVVSGASDSQLNGTHTVTYTSGNSISFTVNEYPPLTSTGSYTATLSSSVTQHNVTSISYTKPSSDGTYPSTLVTVTTQNAHGLTAGETVVISGAANSSYNNSQTVYDVPTSTTFRFMQSVTRATSYSPPTPTVGSGAQVTCNGKTFSINTVTTTSGSNIIVVNVPTLPGACGTNKTMTLSSVTPSSSYSGTAFSWTQNCNGTPSSGVDMCATDTLLTATTTYTPDTEGSGAKVIRSIAAATIATLTHNSSTCADTSGSPAISSTPYVTATTVNGNAHGFVAGDTVILSGTAGTNESAYFAYQPASGYTILTVPSSSSFTFSLSNTTPVTTTPGCTISSSGVSVATSLTSVGPSTLINWVRGYDSIGDELSPGSSINIRPSVHGDVLHSRPAIINYGGGKIVAFYGGNDGVFRAVNANQPVMDPSDNKKFKAGDYTAYIPAGTSTGTPPGGELWGFIAPEHFTQLPRLYNNSPTVYFEITDTTGITPTPTRKDYFFDGNTGVYQDSANNKAYIYLSARRGGRLIYALDVSDPAAPKFLWKKSNSSTGMSELGQTWSQPKPFFVKGHTNPVVIFGGGYDPAEDCIGNASIDMTCTTPASRSMGRAIYLVDAVTGNLLWSATGGGGSNTCLSGVIPDDGSSAQACQLADLTYAFPADVTLMGPATGYKIGRAYAADIGGNIWRIDFEPGGANTTTTWKVRITKFASLGGSDTTIKRKFLYGPDVVRAVIYDEVLAVTGDREHPTENDTSKNTVNRMYMIKDTNVDPADDTAVANWTPVTDTTAYNSTTGPSNLFNAVSGTYDGSLSGFYYTFTNSGEKGVNAPTSIAGSTFFGTSEPPTVGQAGQCRNLGTARSYQINTFTGGSPNVTTFDGGGLPPSPVAGLVDFTTTNADGSTTTQTFAFCIGCGITNDQGGDSKSSIGGGNPFSSTSQKRYRTYWYREHDK
jgi:type IV pilus assembly protein PilY1